MVTGFSIGRGAANKEAEDEEARRREELKCMTVEMIERSREEALSQARQAAASAQAAAQNMATAAAVADYNSASSADSAATQAVNAQSETQAANVTMDAVSSGYGDDVVSAADDAGVYADNTYGVNNTAYDDGRIEQVGDRMYEQGQIDDPELDDEYARRHRGSVEDDETEEENQNPYDEPVYDEEQPALDDQMQQDINQQVRDSLDDEDFDGESEDVVYDDTVYDDTVYDEDDLNIDDIDDDYINEADEPVYDESADVEPEPEPEYTEPEPEPEPEYTEPEPEPDDAPQEESEEDVPQEDEPEPQPQEESQDEAPEPEPDDDGIDMQRETDQAINDVDMTPGTNVPDDEPINDVEAMQSPISDEQIGQDAGGGETEADVASELDDAAGDLGIPEQSSAPSLSLEDVSMSQPTMLSSIYDMCDSVGLADELNAYTGVGAVMSNLDSISDATTSVITGNAREEEAQSQKDMMSYIDQANAAMMKAVGPVADLGDDDLTSKLTSGIGGMMSMLG